MTRVQPAARAEPDPEEPGDPVAMVLRRRPIRTGTVLTQPPPPPPVPPRGSKTEDEPGDVQAQAVPHLEADVVADIDRVITEHAAPTASDPDPGP
jgi:hypothetical protein